MKRSQYEADGTHVPFTPSDMLPVAPTLKMPFEYAV
jgi:hypothetical protein